LLRPCNVDVVAIYNGSAVARVTD